MPHRGQIQHDSRVTCQVVALCEFSAVPRQHDARLPIDTTRRRLLGDGPSVVADPLNPPGDDQRPRGSQPRGLFLGHNSLTAADKCKRGLYRAYVQARLQECPFAARPLTSYGIE